MSLPRRGWPSLVVKKPYRSVSKLPEFLSSYITVSKCNNACCADETYPSLRLVEFWPSNAIVCFGGELRQHATDDRRIRGQGLQEQGSINTVADEFEQAIALLSAGRPEAAAEACRAVLAVDSRHAHALHMLGVIRAEQGALDEGLDLVQRALATGVRHPAIHYAHGNLLMRLERFDEAAQALTSSVALDPGELRSHRLLAVARIRLGRLTEAEVDLHAGLRRLPGNAVLLNALAEVRMAQGRYPEAEELLRQALERDADQADVVGNLALVCEHNNRLQEATQAASDGLARWPEHAQLCLVHARILRRDASYADAYAELTSLLARPQPRVMRRDAEYELGWCADGLGDTELAFSHFSRANALAMDLARPTPAFLEEFPKHMDKLACRFDREWVASWPRLSSERTSPVFLFGFPRSGTTLLDTMLGAHPGLAVMEERPAVQAMLDTIGALGPGYPDKLATIGIDTQSALQAAYFEVARQTGWDRQKRLMDKSPFATAHAGLIQRVFPGAPMLFISRHPCDVVLSCFMNNFGINSGTVHFTDLASTVALYCKLLALWRQFQEVLPLQVHVLQYEALVQAPEQELRAILDFIGLPWASELGDHREHALKRGRIPTPSYLQVSQPLYQTARDRWRRYDKYLHPFIPQLQPFIEALGYES